MLRFLQINLNHCVAAQALLEQTIRELKIHIAVISEPHHRESICPRTWVTDTSGKAAIWACGAPSTLLADTKPFNGFVRARVADKWIYSCYLAPSLQLSAFIAVLDELVDDARGRPGLVIAGDFNAWATEWGSLVTNARGRALLETLASLDLMLLNTGSQNTFSRAGIGSIVDPTFASPSISVGANWKISETYTASDHLAILFTFGDCARSLDNGLPYVKAYRVEQFNTQTFSAAFQSISTDGNAECRANQMSNILTQA